MQYWIMKTEPGAYSYMDLERDGSTHWDGVRNYQARNNMKLMKCGDQVLLYHSVSEKALVGKAEVRKEYYQDPTTDDERWVVVDIIPKGKLARPVTLAEIKEEKRLQDIALVRHSRLSVMPVTKEEYEILTSMSE